MDCCFTNIPLPLRFQQPDAPHAETQNGLNSSIGPDMVKWLMDRAMREFDTWIPRKLYGGVTWVRFSAQMYLEKKGFEWAGAVLQKLCGGIVKGKWRQERDGGA